MAARSVLFINNDPADWVLDELDGRVVPGSGTLDVTDELSDDELIHAIQMGLGADFKDDPNGRYLRINGIDKSAQESQDSPLPYSTPLTDGIMSAQNFVSVVNSLMTGLRSGGYVTVNADPTKFDISAGTAIFVDAYTDPNIPVIVKAVWETQTGITPIGLGVSESTYVGVDDTGALFQKTTPFTFEEKRDHVFIAVVVHPALAGIITDIFMGPRTTGGRDADVADFLDAFGTFNIDGNAILGHEAGDLKVDRTSGLVWIVGGNYVTSLKRPSIVTTPYAHEIPLQYIYRDGSGGFLYPYPPATQIAPGLWDDDSGVLQAVPAASWTVQRIFMYPTDGRLAVQYGQVLYDSQDEAELAINQAFVLDPTLEQTVFRSWLIVKGDATDLTNPAQAKFVLAGKFGLSTVLTGTGGGESNTASNVGSAGVGLFKQKAVVDLEFHKLSSASAAIAVAYDAGTDTVRLTFSLPAHKDSHILGGGDAFLSTDLLDAVVRRLRETGGPTDLLVGAIADGQRLQRSGTNIVGVTPHPYGEEAARSVQDTIASVTGTTAWTTLHTWTTGVLPAGIYKVMWNYDWAYSVTNRDLQRRIQVAGVTVGGPWEVNRTVVYPLWQLSSGYAFITVATPGTRTITVQVSPGGVTDTGYIQFSRLEIIRVE